MGILPVLMEPQNYGKIAFISDRENSGMQIYTMNADGSNQVRKTYTVSEYCKAIFPNGEEHIIENRMVCSNCCPAWSPDGSKIAFTTGFGCHVLQVSILDLNENEIIDIPVSSKASDWAAWSPDGEKIAFVGRINDTSGIYILDTNSNTLIDLTDELKMGKEIAWSPDGKKFTFSSGIYTYIVNVDGTNKKRLTTDGGNSSWSPDGKKIAFDSERDGNAEIYVMDADGSNQINLTNNPANDRDPVWSPDGKKIAFSSNRDGNYEIYVMDTDGSNQINLTNNPADDRFPDWCCQTLLEDTISLLHYIIIVTIISAPIIIVISYKILKKRN